MARRLPRGLSCCKEEHCTGAHLMIAITKQKSNIPVWETSIHHNSTCIASKWEFIGFYPFAAHLLFARSQVHLRWRALQFADILSPSPSVEASLPPLMCHDQLSSFGKQEPIDKNSQIFNLCKMPTLLGPDHECRCTISFWFQWSARLLFVIRNASMCSSEICSHSCK